MNKIWATSTADRKIKEHIFKTRPNKCVFCGRGKGVILDPSHFWGRYVSSTRFLPENIDIVCRGCHYRVEGAKAGEYRDFKIAQLGIKKYNWLKDRYYKVKMSRREAILELMKFLGVR